MLRPHHFLHDAQSALVKRFRLRVLAFFLINPRQNFQGLTQPAVLRPELLRLSKCRPLELLCVRKPAFLEGLCRLGKVVFPTNLGCREHASHPPNQQRQKEKKPDCAFAITQITFLILKIPSHCTASLFWRTIKSFASRSNRLASS